MPLIFENANGSILIPENITNVLDLQGVDVTEILLEKIAGQFITVYSQVTASFLIEYDFDDTYQLLGQMYSKNLGTSGVDLELQSGQCAYLNAVDHDIPLPDFGATSMIYLHDGVQIYTETPFYSFLGIGGVFKDLYYFSDSLTTAEKLKHLEKPDNFFVDSKNGIIDNCLSIIAFNGTDEYVIDYVNFVQSANLWTAPFSVGGAWIDNGDDTFYYDATGISAIAKTVNSSGLVSLNFTISGLGANLGRLVIFDNAFSTIKSYNSLIDGDYTILDDVGSISKYSFYGYADTGGITRYPFTLSNVEIKELSGVYAIDFYTNSVRQFILNYGSQESSFEHSEVAGVAKRENKSLHYEADAIGTATIPNHTDNVNINLVVNPKELIGNILSGGITLDTTGLTIGVDNNIELLNQTPTGAITLADGFKGTIKTYTEELV